MRTTTSDQRLTAPGVGAAVARAARAGATPAELADLATRLATELRDQPAPPGSKRDRGTAGLAGMLRRTLRALDRRLDDDPQGVAAVLGTTSTEVDAAKDRAAERLRESRQHGWPVIADLLGVSVATARRRWGHYPGGLPEGGQAAEHR